MSWDIFVQDILASVMSVAEMPDGFEPRSLGKRADIIARIRAVVPIADFTQEACGRIEGPGFSIEVAMGDLEDVQGFAFHVYGGDLGAHAVANVLQELGFRAFDPSSPSGIFEPEIAAAGLDRWRTYRDKMMREK
jgi:hypothetical protein